VAGPSSAVTVRPGVPLDLMTLEGDPYPTWERLRRLAPVCHVPEAHAWFVTRWDDVLRVSRDADAFSAAVHTSPLSSAIGPNLLHSDGATHARQRSPLTAALRPSAVRARMEQAILAGLEPLVAGLGRDADLVRDLAEPLAVRTLRQVAGLPDLDDDVLRRWLDGISAGASNYEKDPVKAALARAAGEEVDEVVARAVRDGAPESSLLHVVTSGERRLSSAALAEVCATVKLLIIGGMQEPRDLLGTALHALLTFPAVRAEVLADLAAGVPRLVEESLRWCSPVGTVTRITTAPVVLSGTELPAGEVVAAVLASANRDPARWDNPDEFLLHRRDHQHLAFAAGAHTCVGAALARREVELALHRLLSTYPDLQPAGPAPFRGWEFRGPTAVPVTLAATTARPGRAATVSHDRTVEVVAHGFVAADVLELTLAADNGAALPSWEPGAHLDVHLPGGRTRQYSLCGPLGASTWTIAVRREPDGRGGSSWLHEHAQEGVRLRVGVPRNHFPLRDAAAYAFVAGGIGITPLLPMIEVVSALGRPWSLLLLGKDRTAMPYVDHPLLQGPETTVVETSRTGRPVLLQGIPPGAEVYCCGPESLLSGVAAAGFDRGLRVHAERFSPRTAARGRRPGDRPFLARLSRTGVTVTVDVGESLLDRLADEGVLLPSSCRAGTCGSCEVTVLAGTPEHHDSVLGDDERDRGDVLLACVSRGRGELVLDV
jgi:cytochrome P450/ferredoxin-NADP reductase